MIVPSHIAQKIPAIKLTDHKRSTDLIISVKRNEEKGSSSSDKKNPAPKRSKDCPDKIITNGIGRI